MCCHKRGDESLTCCCIVVCSSLSLDEVHLLNTHNWNINYVTSCRRNLLTAGTELEVAVGTDTLTLETTSCPLLLCEVGYILVVSVSSVRTNDQLLTEVGVRHTLVRCLAYAWLCTRAITPTCSRAHMCSPRVEVRDYSLSRLNHTQHPSVVSSAESVDRVAVLSLCQWLATRSGDSQTSILGSLLVGSVTCNYIRILCNVVQALGETAQPEVSTSLQTVNYSQRRDVLCAWSEVSQASLCIVQIVQDELEHLLTWKAWVVLGIRLSGVLINDRHCQTLDSCQSCLILRTLSRYSVEWVVQTSQVEIVECTISLCNTALLCQSRVVTANRDKVVGSLDELVVVVPEERAIASWADTHLVVIELESVEVLVTARVPVRWEYLTNSVVGVDHQRWITEVVVIFATIDIIGDENCRDRSDHTIRCEWRVAYLIGSSATSELICLLNTACCQYRSTEQNSCKLKYIVHFHILNLLSRLN